MGTNYYLHEKPDCECCGRPHEPLHIGKSSAGWNFLVHIMPEYGINRLDDWRARWSKPGTYIRNEYGDRVPIEVMESAVTQRAPDLKRTPWHDKNCYGYGEGTWDYITGDFS